MVRRERVVSSSAHVFYVGMLSAAASLGLSHLWDPDVGLTNIDKYTYSSEENIKVGCSLNLSPMD